MLLVVGRGDSLLYKRLLNAGKAAAPAAGASAGSGVSAQPPELGGSGLGLGLGSGLGSGSDMDELMCLAALEKGEVTIWQTTSCYVKFIMRGFYLHYMVNGTKLLLSMKPVKNDECIRLFFQELQELILRFQLNPFHNLNDTLYSEVFDRHAQALISKHLTPNL